MRDCFAELPFACIVTAFHNHCPPKGFSFSQLNAFNWDNNSDKLQSVGRFISVFASFKCCFVWPDISPDSTSRLDRCLDFALVH